MNKSEVVDLIDNEIKTRWKKWDPTDTDYLDYSTFLAPFDERVAVIAIQQHRSRAHRVEPTLATLIQYCKELAPTPKQTNYHDPIKQLGEYEHTVFVQCVEGPALGHFIPTTFGSDRANHEAGEQYHIAAAQRLKDQYTNYENGIIYEIVASSNYGDMVQRRTTLQASRVVGVVSPDTTPPSEPTKIADKGGTEPSPVMEVLDERPKAPQVDEDSPEYKKLISEIPF